MVVCLAVGSGGRLLMSVAVVTLEHLDVVGLLTTLLGQHQGRQHTEKEARDTARIKKEELG